MQTKNTIFGPKPTIRQTAWLAVYGMFCFAVPAVAGALIIIGDPHFIDYLLTP